jgi:hypothetical protein
MDFAEVISDGTPFTTVRENCDNGNIQVKGKAVNICNLMIFLECLMQLNSLIKTSENNLKSK